jgi:hypothetical protein
MGVSSSSQKGPYTSESPHYRTAVVGGVLFSRGRSVPHVGIEASEHARRESLREADLTHQAVEARIGAERIDEWIAK